MGLTALEHVKTEQSTFTPSQTEDFGLEIVPFGIYHVDSNLIMGVKPASPQLNVIQGGGGSRKTTLLLNIIINMCLSGKLPPGHKIIYDTLENGFTIERGMIVLRAIIATKYIIYMHYAGYRAIYAEENVSEYLNTLFSLELPPTGDPAAFVQEITFTHSGREVCECSFTPDFIEAWYLGKVHLTKKQTEAWIVAGEALRDFPIEFFGVSEHPNYDEAERRSTSTIMMEQSYERWCRLSEECLSVQIIADYLQEYWLPGSNDHYQKQLAFTPWFSRFIKEKRKTVWVVSQEGIQHQKDFSRSGFVYGSSGGDVLKNASQNNWRVSYTKETSPYTMTLHSPVKSRRGNHPDLTLLIEPNSGAIFGKSKIAER